MKEKETEWEEGRFECRYSPRERKIGIVRQT